MVEQLDAVKVEVAAVECGMMEQQSWLDVVTQPRHIFFSFRFGIVGAAQILKDFGILMLD